MKVGYTEFSYGYALTENIIRSMVARPKSAPFFPNLIQEAALGYDVKIDRKSTPIFLQFKLPELMVRDTALELTKYGCKNLKTPFFRITLMKDDISDQHNTLVDLETKFPKSVYYASACISKLSAFNYSYVHGKIVDDSAFMRPSAIGKITDGKRHFLSYMSGSKFAYFCSQPRDIDVLRFGEVIDVVSELLINADHDLEKMCIEVREKIVSLNPGALNQLANFAQERVARLRSGLTGLGARASRSENAIREMLVTRQVARIGIGVEFIVAQQQ